MPTQVKSVGPNWVPVAQGPGEAVFSFDDEYGRFTVHGSADPAGIVSGHKQPPQTPYTITLATGDVLHLVGRGTATVTAATADATTSAAQAAGSAASLASAVAATDAVQASLLPLQPGTPVPTGYVDTGATLNGLRLAAPSGAVVDASALQVLVDEAIVQLDAAAGQVAAIVGQTYKEVESLRAAQENTFTLAEAISLIGQLSDQINGGQITLRGGSLADPPLKIGTAGIYSSAADTLSVAIAGVERLRITGSGITVYGTVTEA